MKTYKLVLMRHGESKWNQLNRFTGWHDIDLSENGVQEALQAAIFLEKKGFNNFNYAYTSVLKRAIHTLWIIIKYLNKSWIPIKKTWRLNERHYGALEGKNKNDIIKKYGNTKVQMWRRSFHVTPPKISHEKKAMLATNPQYHDIDINILPRSESLQLTTSRVLPYWHNEILPCLKKNNSIIVVAHGNSLRALIKYLSNIDDADIINLDIPTGSPIIYEFDEKLEPTKYYHLK
ncbi:MAG: 2,3-diphosphoglycerate-dependent phosphoglycerate mutase [Buchnera aphidicola (Chaetogeoica yunlongensis)]